jgi:hypothetical protein
LKIWLAWPTVFLNICRKDRLKDNLQKNVLVPFDDSLVYVDRFIAGLVFSAVSLELKNHMKASRDPSETKSEISCANSLRKSVNSS